MKLFGIDISMWQGDFNLDKAMQQGAKYVIIRCGGSDGGTLFTDPKYESNYKRAEAIGMPKGVYYFGCAKTKEEAIKEAKHCLTLLKGKKFEYPIFYDVEDNKMRVGVDKLTEIIKAFCDTLEKAGYWTGIYTNYDWYMNAFKGAELGAKYSLWFAWWGASELPTDKKIREQTKIWQFDANYVADVQTDRNYCYYDFPTAIKNKGLNGFKKPTATTGTSTNASSGSAVATAVKLKINGTNATRRTNQLIVYNKGKNATTNKWGAEVAVDKNGCALTDAKYGAYNTAIPSGGFVLSGHGTMSARLIETVKKGYKVVIKNGYAEITKANLKPTASIKVGDNVKVTDPIIYGTDKKFVKYYETYKVIELNGNRAVIGIANVPTTAIDIKYLIKA